MVAIVIPDRKALSEITHGQSLQVSTAQCPTPLPLIPPLIYRNTPPTTYPTTYSIIHPNHPTYPTPPPIHPTNPSPMHTSLQTPPSHIPKSTS